MYSNNTVLKNKAIKLFISLTTFAVLVSCSKITPQAPAADSVMDAPLDGLNSSQVLSFNRGAAVFDKVYNSENGLGPIFVAPACGNCHSADNRGHFDLILTRFGQSDSSGNLYLNQGAPQIQNRALPGHTPEQLPAMAVSSKFIAPIVSGSGFLELVSDADILAMSDPDDNNGDGISGVPNWNKLPDYETPIPGAISRNGKYICRFGRKASTYNLYQQSVQAFNQDMGVTSQALPLNPGVTNDAGSGTRPSDPEVSEKEINDLVFYLQALQTPLQRNQSDAQVLRGKELFVTAGCEACHKSSLKTGYSPVDALSNKEFHPYTDLLLHNMGAGLNDGYTEGSALPSEWRTTPLWGLGLASDAQGGKYFLLHDGRAASIEEAIELHGGEAQKSRDAYIQFSQADKETLIKFLKSL